MANNPNEQTDQVQPDPKQGVLEGTLMESAPQPSETSALAKTIQDLHETEAIPLFHEDEETGEDIPHALVLPAGKRLISVKPFRDQYLKTPERLRGTAQFTELASFIAHVNRTKNPDTLLFGDATNNSAKLIAVYDYHAAGENPKPTWQEHRAEYAFPISDEWKAWKGREGEANKMSMQKFAEFLESRVVDVALPSAMVDGSIADQMQKQLGVEFASPSRLIQISKNIALNVDQQFVEASDAQGGAKNFSFIEKNKDGAGAPFKIESGFLINIPVFRGDKRWIIPVQLRYRKPTDGAKGIMFFYDVYRMDLHFFESVKAACKKVSEETKLEVLMGTPERSGA